ncbi:serine/threonine-protein phosphatase 7 long form homolog [Gossypium hirsutum]|uniref:Serine/threonine-protein phosphatase 7 long form homolog n=1 Tax=Gossypium hirsutum TaxID=3635 RepID=A0A1U8KWV6_GOSHI|nr:serine/threonine-protein phosphatase 7 long form homolog [Gossypium hirsutum]
MYINNLSKGAPEVVHGHLQDVGFLNVARMLEGNKLDPPLISALIERWRPETNTFHLPYDQCTITLEDVNLQLSLLVDGDVITGPVVTVDWTATREQLLGKVLNKFRDSWIKMRCLEDNIQTMEASVSDVEKEQFTCAFILSLIGGVLMPNKSRNLKVTTTTS